MSHVSENSGVPQDPTESPTAIAASAKSYATHIADSTPPHPLFFSFKAPTDLDDGDGALVEDGAVLSANRVGVDRIDRRLHFLHVCDVARDLFKPRRVRRVGDGDDIRMCESRSSYKTRPKKQKNNNNKPRHHKYPGKSITPPPFFPLALHARIPGCGCGGSRRERGGG